MSAKNKLATPLTVVLALIVIAGFATWVFQTMNGLGSTTGMNNSISWGAYIIMFVFFVGLSAGGLIVAASAEVFDIESFKPISKPAVLTSTVCICGAGAFVLLDLGSIQNILGMFVHPNFTSPLVWDMCIITTYLIMNIIELVVLVKDKPAKTKKVVSCVTLPVAIVVHSVTAWIFGLQIAKAGWYSSIMAPLFVASALDSGLGLLMIVLLIMNARNLISVSSELFNKLGKLLATCVAVDGYMIGCELLTMGYPGDEAGLVVLQTMTAGATAPFFWFEVICGIIIPFILLASKKRRESKAILAVSGALIACGVFCKRVWLVLSSMMQQNAAAAPGVTTGSSDYPVWVTVGQYMPQLPEIVICAAVVAGVILLFVLLWKGVVSDSAHADQTREEACVSVGSAVTQG